MKLAPKADSGKQDVVAEYRRSQILAAAVKLFGEKGFDATHMEEIAKTARLAKGTVYFYFNSKDAMYQAALEEAFTKLNQLTEELTQRNSRFEEKVAELIRARIDYWSQHEALYRMILTWTHATQLRKRKVDFQGVTVGHLEQIFEEAGQAGIIPEQNYEAAAWATLDVIRGFIERKILSKARMGAQDTRFLTEFILNAVQTRAK